MEKINYKDEALRQFVERYGIVKTHLARLFNQTNNLTVDRWLSGKDIYFGSLLTICNTYRLDLLSFLRHGDKPFATTIEDIALMEDAGLNLRELMKERGVELAQPGCHALSSDDTAPLTLHAAGHDTQPQATKEPSITNFPSDVIDKIIMIQTRAYEHEQASLQQQRADLQNIIDRQDAEIAELKKELRRNKNASVQYIPAPQNIQMVADSTEHNYNTSAENDN